MSEDPVLWLPTSAATAALQTSRRTLQRHAKAGRILARRGWNGRTEYAVPVPSVQTDAAPAEALADDQGGSVAEWARRIAAVRVSAMVLEAARWKAEIRGLADDLVERNRRQEERIRYLEQLVADQAADLSMARAYILELEGRTRATSRPPEC